MLIIIVWRSGSCWIIITIIITIIIIIIILLIIVWRSGGLTVTSLLPPRHKTFLFLVLCTELVQIVPMLVYNICTRYDQGEENSELKLLTPICQ